jgi:hypothetical protein
MELLKNLLQENEKIWFEITESEKREFLRFAQSQGCLWTNGQEIFPETDDCSLHMSIHRDLRIANVAYFVWFHTDFDAIPKFVFSDFVKGISKAPESRLLLSTPDLIRTQ